MCGVVSIVYGRDNARLGREGAELLKHLEYRGYDSTGLATLSEAGAITLRKRVGAPSRVVVELSLPDLQGQKAIGQVRWATYGSVTDANAQPHEVACRVHMVGAHNGNISNTDVLKEFLHERRHRVLSDNDGEMLVHVIEHFFAEEGGLLAEGDARRAAALRAIRRANAAVVGSYAACVAFPGVPGVFALKAGSSLYAGQGSDEAGGFVVVSSDLTSVLSKTRFLIPLAEGEGLHFTHDAYRVFSLSGDTESTPALRRSRLNVADIALQPRYRFFMEQEIDQAAPNLELLQRYYFPRPEEEAEFQAFARRPDEAHALVSELLELSRLASSEALSAAAAALGTDARLQALEAALPPLPLDAPFLSDEGPWLAELAGGQPALRPRLLRLDHLAYWDKKRKVLQASDGLLALLAGPAQVYLVGSGTSYHACLTGSVFFGRLAARATHACNPGYFRSAYLPGLRPGDVVVGVTQSGETKDLVDVFNDVRERHGAAVHLVSLVNNENSTIPQEKSELFLPILCGPEIAVAATKSFVSQLALLYVLAARLNGKLEVAARVGEIRRVISETLAATAGEVAEVAGHLYLRPSLHILGTSLIGLAREGALKVREVVLNHTEGYDAAEFKHGPNTILGHNTIFSLADLEAAAAAGRPLQVERHFSNYPLLFVCPPDERDVRITISQIHTHKIRGADVVLLAEEDDGLRRAVEGRPDRPGEYYTRYLRVPRTGDPDLFVFQAAVVLQALALRMSVAKMERLDAAGVAEHGVHPDVPKNVSKSITVD